MNLNSNIKITGGTCRGRSLLSFPGDRTRPTSSKVRQALFNILGTSEGLCFLDVYAGTGSVGIEALSRGAKQVDFVESHKQTSLLIQSNLDKCKFSNSLVHHKDAKQFLNESCHQKKWDVVFVDPPFVKEYPTDFLWETLVVENGVLIFQFPSKKGIEWPKLPDKTYHYGESSLAFFYY